MLSICEVGHSIPQVLRPGTHPKYNLLVANLVQRLFWDGIEVINMLIDLALIVLPTITVLKLQTSWERKSTVLVAFAIRIVY